MLVSAILLQFSCHCCFLDRPGFENSACGVSFIFCVCVFVVWLPIWVSVDVIVVGDVIDHDVSALIDASSLLGGDSSDPVMTHEFGDLISVSDIPDDFIAIETIDDPLLFASSREGWTDGVSCWRDCPVENPVTDASEFVGCFISSVSSGDWKFISVGGLSKDVFDGFDVDCG